MALFSGSDTNNACIGVDIGSSGIKMVELKREINAWFYQPMVLARIWVEIIP